ncbi:MAG TPA: glycerol-3-phosphate cytidylyltransferase [Saprospirales bacterium]|nr:glycerol-3-phosphate cytidylyltransferase [Saprospirales bacterium]
MTCRVGFTCGAFDLLHAGHIVMLREAKNNCDYLIVGLQTDPTIDRQEKNSPIQSVYERYIQLRGVKYIDEIIPYDTEQSLLDLLEATEIHLRFVGEDYVDREFTGKGLHEVFYTSRQHSFSTTQLRNRVNENSSNR